MFITKLDAKIVTVKNGELFETNFGSTYLDFAIGSKKRAMDAAIELYGIKNAKGLVVDFNTITVPFSPDLKKLYEEAIEESFIPDDYLDMDKKEVTEDDKNDTEG